MQVERKALYNLLRMNWQLDPHIKVEPWQIENYRILPLEDLFEMLKDFNITLERNRFLDFANQYDTPEELSDFLSDEANSVQTEDRIYLIIFELWRRLVPEKPCISILSDELDYQINLYDREELLTQEPLQDALANLQAVLDENVDQGVDPIEVFISISAGCAHDVESFLYDFIAEQIDNDNYSYASELLDDFSQYVTDVKWFDFLRARISAPRDAYEANLLLKHIIEEHAPDKDLEFNLELLSFMAREGEKDLFIKLVKLSLPLLQVEEDFQDLLSICNDYYHYLDQDKDELAIQMLLSKRAKNALGSPLNAHDPDFLILQQMLEKSGTVEKTSSKSTETPP